MFYTNKTRYYALLLILPLVMLNIPKITTGIALIATFEIVLTLLLFKYVSPCFLARLSLLILFTVVYYVVSYGYGFIDAASACKYAMYIIGLYLLGYSIGVSNTPKWPYGLIWQFLSLVTGGVVFAFLCVYKDIQSKGILQVEDRVVQSFWGGGNLINGPGLGSLASLGICLLPVVLLGTRESLTRKCYTLLMVFSIVLVAAGSFANIALQNRSPFVALAVAVVVCLVLIGVRGRPKNKSILARVFIIGAAGAALAVVVVQQDFFEQFTIVSRFSERGLSTTGRSSAWVAMIGGFFESLVGGRYVNIGNLKYVHNLWLDVAYDTGIVPFTLLLVFHLAHLRCFTRIIRSRLPLILVMIITCIAVSYVAAFAVEPALNFSAMYFASSCFFLGLVLRLSEEMEAVDMEAYGTNAYYAKD